MWTTELKSCETHLDWLINPYVYKRAQIQLSGQRLPQVVFPFALTSVCSAKTGNDTILVQKDYENKCHVEKWELKLRLQWHEINVLLGRSGWVYRWYFAQLRYVNPTDQLFPHIFCLSIYRSWLVTDITNRWYPNYPRDISFLFVFAWPQLILHKCSFDILPSSGCWSDGLFSKTPSTSQETEILGIEIKISW